MPFLEYCTAVPAAYVKDNTSESLAPTEKHIASFAKITSSKSNETRPCLGCATSSGGGLGLGCVSASGGLGSSAGFGMDSGDGGSGVGGETALGGSGSFLSFSSCLNKAWRISY